MGRTPCAQIELDHNRGSAEAARVRRIGLPLWSVTTSRMGVPSRRAVILVIGLLRAARS